MTDQMLRFYDGYPHTSPQLRDTVRELQAMLHRYDRAVEYTAQLARLTPQDNAGQRVLSWRVVEPPARPLPATDDGYGNVVHSLTIRRRHTEATILAEGEVETHDTQGILRGALERLPPDYFLRRTAPTEESGKVPA